MTSATDQPRRSAAPRTDSVISDERFQRLPRLRPAPGRQQAHVLRRQADPRPLLPGLVSPPAHRAGARPLPRRHDRRLQPPQLPRPVRDRSAAPLAPADAVRRQGRAVRASLVGLAALAPRRLPDPPRAVRRDGDGDRPPRGRARRHGRHLPRGDPHPLGLAQQPQARGRPPGPGIGRCRAAGRGAGLRARSPWLAGPPAQGEAPRRPPDDLPPYRTSLARPRRHGHRPDLAQRRAAVGVARRPAAAAQGRGDRRRQLGDRAGGPVGAGRPRGAARDALCREGRRSGRESESTRSSFPG